MSLYNADGQPQVNIVPGTSYVGSTSPDGQLNGVLDATPTVYKGSTHPSGALNVQVTTDPYSGSTAPDGSRYIAANSTGYSLVPLTGQISSNLPVGGFKIGDQGTGIYTGYTLAWADDFLSTNLAGPSTPNARWGGTQIYGSAGRRGGTTVLGTAYDSDPRHTGYNDANHGVAYPFDNWSVSNSVLRLWSRQATAQEQSMFSPTAGGINGGVRPQISAMAHTAGSMIMNPGTNAIIWEARIRYTANGPDGWHPTFWTSVWNPALPANGNNWNVEGNSARAQFGQNPYSNGVPGANVYGSPFTTIYDDNNFHTLTMVLRNGGNTELYIDGVLVTSATGVSANPLNTPTYGLISSHVYNATYDGEAYDAAQWASSGPSGGASIYVDWVRVWKTTGVTDYTPLTTIPNQTTPYNGSGSVVLPSVTTLWGDAAATQYVQALQYEGTEPGNTATTTTSRFPPGITLSGNTLSWDFSGVQGNAGAIHIAVGAYKNGTVCVPALFTINREPRLMTGNITATTGNPIASTDLYALSSVGNNLPKTLNVSNLAPGLSIDSNYVVTGTPSDTSGTSTVVITDSLGAQTTRTFTYNDYDADTNALIARFATRPSKAKCDAFDACIKGLKADGVWSTLYKLSIYALDDAQAARVNWIPDTTLWSRLVATPTFTAGAGFTTNGTTNGIDTGVNLATTFASATSVAFSVWSLTSGQTANGGVGVYDGSTSGLTMNLRTTTDTFTARCNDNTADSVASLAGNGMFTVVRRAASGAACKSLYKNGANVGDFTTAYVSGFGGSNLGIGVSLGNNSFAARQWAMDAAGSARSDAQETAFYNRIRTLMTALGVP